MVNCRLTMPVNYGDCFMVKQLLIEWLLQWE